MGQSIAAQEGFQPNAINNFLRLQTAYDYSLGEVTLVQDTHEKKFYLLKRKKVSSPEERSKLCSEVFIRSRHTHPNMVRLYGFLPLKYTQAQAQTQQFPGYGPPQLQMEPELELILDFVDYTLASELNKRRKKQSPLSEPELWYFAFSIIGAASHLQDRGIGHTAINPRNIMLTRDGKVKLYDYCMIHDKPMDYGKLLEKKGYYCPLQMKNIESGRRNYKYNIFKSDVFSFGLTLLEAATLVNITESVYDWNKKAINIYAIQSLLSYLPKTCSDNLINLISSCLHLDEKLRPDWEDLERKYQTKLSPVIHQIPQLTDSPKSTPRSERSPLPQHNPVPRPLPQDQQSYQWKQQKTEPHEVAPYFIPPFDRMAPYDEYGYRNHRGQSMRSDFPSESYSASHSYGPPLYIMPGYQQTQPR
eukprot:TRINITY_DN2136_c0_g2_i1.p1 TRINITY_DN2136_c0_g2~~TRINITY_DN2136_c0_g2_i1.p1  ORF type:complete len:417 (-),score=63.38 TRINITY_DN2136_c0_g2_i1:86-1336(-)